jgi:hypothetical protein
MDLARNYCTTEAGTAEVVAVVLGAGGQKVYAWPWHA